MMSMQFLQSMIQPFGRAYSHVMHVREELYRRGGKHSWPAPVPVVSVGNISMGGTGKTPLAQWILEQAVEQGTRPVLLTRGYRGKPPHLPFLVKDDSNPAQSGDEPLLLARACPGAKVVVDPVRSRGGRWAMKNVRPKLIVLDDGFQHLAVQRDVNLVLLSPEDVEEGWDHVFPAGKWREGKEALRRADAFLFRLPEERFRKLEPVIRNRLEPYGKPVFSFSVQPKSVIAIANGNRTLCEGRYIFAAGIGNPAQAVESTSNFFSREPEEVVTFRDHHEYTATDATRLLSIMKKHDACKIIVTPKDAVKLERFAGAEFATLKLGLTFGPSLFTDTTFPDWLQIAIPSK